MMVCLRCRHALVPSGQEPHRFVCSDCGQNYFAVMQLVPTEPLRLPALSEAVDVEQDSGAR